MFVSTLKNIATTVLHLGEIYWGRQFICDSLLILVALIAIMYIFDLYFINVKLATECLDACPQSRSVKYFWEIGRKWMLLPLYVIYWNLL